MLFTCCSYQADFDVVWCRGTVGEKIFAPLVRQISENGGRFLSRKRVSDLVLDEVTGAVTAVKCGDEVYEADAVVFSVGISGLQKIVAGR